MAIDDRDYMRVPRRTGISARLPRGVSKQWPLAAVLAVALLAVLFRGGWFDRKPRPPVFPLDLNSASAEQLEWLPGVGPAIAQRIIQARPFKSIDDLARVNGIGKKTLNGLRPYATASPPAKSPRRAIACPAPVDIILLMSATIIDGTALAASVKAEVATLVAALNARGRGVHLVAMLIGSTPAGEIYAQRQAESCRAVGIRYDLLAMPDDVSMKQVKDEIRKLNADPSVTGIMMHLPLPPHLDTHRLQYEIDVVKDVEGVNPANIGYVVYGRTLIAPATALSVMELIKSTGVEIRGAEATVVGASEIAGKPIALLLTELEATPTVCHIATRDVTQHTRRADILVVAVGKAGLIGADHVKDGAVVIDVGINRVTMPDGSKKTIGDVQFEAVKEKAAFLSPVPGGVGPMTVAMLLKNVVTSANLQAGMSRL